MSLDVDTIAAIATPAGRGGIGVIRVSGPDAERIGRAVCGRDLEPRRATLCDFLDADANVVDRGIALWFVGPHSYTGEDVLELQGHGGPVVMQMLLDAVAGLGARLARPGEFSERAFLNERIDLAQAEAVADLIDSASRTAARGAMRALAGEFSAAVSQVASDMVELRVFVEAGIDFPDEEIDLLSDDRVARAIADIGAGVRALRAQSQVGRVLSDGLYVVITGAPNVGKSTLLNALAGEAHAIVTDIPGTTRDLLDVDLVIDGIPVRLVDTAGLRRTNDPVEREGVRRARAARERADLELVMVDATVVSGDALVGADEDETERSVAPYGVVVVRNKCDLTGERPARGETSAGRRWVTLSASSGEGLELLVASFREAVGVSAPLENAVTARARHVEALDAALGHVDSARAHAEAGAGELVAEELRSAHDALGAIVGHTSADDLLGEIFASFCIGK